MDSAVAFVVTMLSEDRDQYLSNIWMVDTVGGEPRRFTTGPKRDTKPRWSPDGTRLAFLSEREAQPKAQVYVIPAAGGEPTRLTKLPNGVMQHVWSPDGTRLALVARVGGWQEPASEEERQQSKPVRIITALKYKANGRIYLRPAAASSSSRPTAASRSNSPMAISPTPTNLVARRHATGLRLRSP
jgi:Tol biopolymer transport system component